MRNIKSSITIFLFVLLSPLLYGQTGLIAHFPLNADAKDASGNGHDGFIRGNPTAVPDRHGNAKSAYYFDGVDDHIAVPYHADLQPKDGVTLSLWLHNSDWTSFIPFSGVAGNTESGGYGLYIYEYTNNSGMWGYLRRNGSYAQLKYSLDALDTGWHHFALTYTKDNWGHSTATLYVDGKREKGHTLYQSAHLIEYSNQNAFIIGAEAGATSLPEGDYYKGSIDEVMVFDRALSEQEIIHLYWGAMDYSSINKNDALQIYPNPAEGFANLILDQKLAAQELMISIYDPSGKLVRSIISRDNQKIRQVNLEQLEAGYYLLSVQSEGWLAHKRLIISK